MHPQLKYGGRVIRDLAGSRHCGWNGALTRMKAVSSSVRGWKSPWPKKFYGVVRCCHKDRGMFRAVKAA